MWTWTFWMVGISWTLGTLKIDVHYTGFLRRSHQRWDDVQRVPHCRHTLPDRDYFWCLAVDSAKQNNRRVFKGQCLLTTLTSGIVLCFGAGVIKLTEQVASSPTLLELGPIEAVSKGPRRESVLSSSQQFNSTTQSTIFLQTPLSLYKIRMSPFSTHRRKLWEVLKILFG